MPEAPSVKFRHNVAIALAGVVGVVAMIPLAGSRWYLTPLLVLPLLLAVWGWRSGVDVDPGGVTVRALVGSRRLPWREISGFTTRGRRVYVLAHSGAVALPAVSPGDVSTLIEAGGQDLVAAASGGPSPDGARDHEPGQVEPGETGPGDTGPGGTGPDGTEPREDGPGRGRPENTDGDAAQ